MLYESLSGVVHEINQHINSKVGLSEDKVVLSALVNRDGSVPAAIHNKVVLTLINAEKEGAHGRGNTGSSTSNNSNKGPLQLNVYVLFAACFEENNYEEGLKFLSYVVAFLHYKNMFHAQNSDIDPRAGQLEFSIAKMTFTEISNVWSYLGAKYSPSVIYHIRYVQFDDEYITGVGSVISGLGLGSLNR